MQKSFLQKTWVVAGVAFLCSALWGSAFAGVKIGYNCFRLYQRIGQHRWCLLESALQLLESWHWLAVVLLQNKH